MDNYDVLMRLARSCRITDFLALSQVNRSIRKSCQLHRQPLLDLFRGRIFENQEWDFDGINFPFFLYQKDEDQVVFRIFMHDFTDEDQSHGLYRLMAALERDFARRCRVLFQTEPPSIIRKIGTAVPIFFIELSVARKAIEWDDLPYYFKRADHPTERRAVYRNFEIFGEIRGLWVRLIERYSQEGSRLECTFLTMPNPIVEGMEEAAHLLEKELTKQDADSDKKKKRKRRKKKQPLAEQPSEDQ